MRINRFRRHMVNILAGFLIIQVGVGCGSPEIKIAARDYDKLGKMVIPNDRTRQNFAAVIRAASIKPGFANGESAVLTGMAYLYQAEVYEIAASLISMMQVDLYYGSDDREHGNKFPINMSSLDNENYNQLAMMNLFDLWSVKGKNGVETAIESGGSVYPPNFVRLVRQHLNDGRPLTPESILSNDALLAVLVEEIPTYAKGIKVVELILTEIDNSIVRKIDEGHLLTENLFAESDVISYFNASPFHIASIIYERMGRRVLTGALDSEFVSENISDYRMMGILALAQLYGRSDQYESLLRLWEKERHFILTQQQLLSGSICSSPYYFAIDWQSFARAAKYAESKGIATNLIDFSHNICEGISDPIRDQLITYSTNIESLDDPGISAFIHKFISDPDLIGRYPTIGPGFYRNLHLSATRKKYKSDIQTISESLIFDPTRSARTLIRNRSAFLLSTIGVFRWHGGRIPDCIGFVIDLQEDDPNLLPLRELLKIFINQLNRQAVSLENTAD